MGANRVASRRAEKWDCLNPIQVRYQAALRPDDIVFGSLRVYASLHVSFNGDSGSTLRSGHLTWIQVVFPPSVAARAVAFRPPESPEP